MKSWSKRGFDLTHHWSKLFKDIYKISIDNKLREFAFKLFHRILVTNNELKRFKMRNDDAWFPCQNADSLEHTFLECPVSIKFYQEVYACKMTESHSSFLLFFTNLKLQWKSANLI